MNETGLVSGISQERTRTELRDERHRRAQCRPVGSPAYEELTREGKLFAVLQEVGYYCRFYFEGKGGQGRVLRILLREGEMPQKELTQRLGIQPGSASELLGKLERSGFIERRTQEEDRRGAVVRVTERGREHANERAKEREDRIRVLFSGLTEEERDTLLMLTEKLYGSWQTKKEAGGTRGIPGENTGKEGQTGSI